MSTLTADWYCWVVENLALNVPAAVIEKTLIANGIGLPEAQSVVQQVRDGVAGQAATHLYRQRQKLSWQLSTLAHLRFADDANTQVARRRDLGGEEFFSYYHSNTPVVMEGAACDWPAARHWPSAGYLRDRFGSMTVEIQGSRGSDPLYERHSQRHKSHLLFSEFVDWVESIGASNDRYMTANNSGANAAFLRAAMQDVTLPENICSPDTAGRTFIWYGPQGTITPMHHDMTNNCVAQIVGRKLVRLISPLHLPDLYNDQHCFSGVDLDSPDHAKYPRFKNAKILDVEVGPGDMLFIPVGWWHHVRSLSSSISVSFTNFRAPNDFSAGYKGLDGPI